MPRDERLYLSEIGNAIDRILTYTEDGQASFLRSSQQQEAVYWNLVVIGEAANKLTRELLAEAPKIAWRDVVAMRNLLAHEYFHIEPEVVWRTVERDLPDLREAVSRILSNLGDPPSHPG